MQHVKFWAYIVASAAIVAYTSGVGPRVSTLWGGSDPPESPQIDVARADTAAPESRATSDSSSAAPMSTGHALGGDPTWIAELSAELTEISGIAFDAKGRLFAHGDEDGTVWEVEPRTGKIVKRFAVASTGASAPSGKKAARRAAQIPGVEIADFEDIAIVGEDFFLVTSDGTLYRVREGADGARVRAAVFDTGLDGRCEVEGLAHDSAAAELLLLCKENLPKKSGAKQVIVRAWSLRSRRLAERPRLVVDYAALAGATGSQSFNGAALAVAPGARSVVLVAGPQKSYAELTLDGEVAAAGPLQQRVHRQPEGLAFAPDGSILVANEGAGGAATLSAYAKGGDSKR